MGPLATAARSRPGRAGTRQLGAPHGRQTRRAAPHAPWHASPPAAPPHTSPSRASSITASASSSGSAASGSSPGPRGRPPAAAPRGPAAALLQPLLGAVVRATAGRLASLPPVLLCWLLRLLASPLARLAPPPPAAWLAEAFEALAGGVGALDGGKAAAAFMAVAGLTASGASQPGVLLVLPPSELLHRLYGRLEAATAGAGAGSGAQGSPLDPRDALGCLECAAAVAAAAGSLLERDANLAAAAAAPGVEPRRSRTGVEAGAGGGGGWGVVGVAGLAEGAPVGGASPQVGAVPGVDLVGSSPPPPCLLDPPMPSSAVEALLAAAGVLPRSGPLPLALPEHLDPGDGAQQEAGGQGASARAPSLAAATATARALRAVAALPNGPQRPAVAHLAASLLLHGPTLLPEEGWSAANVQRQQQQDRPQLQPSAPELLYLDGLVAAARLRCPPLAPGCAAAAALERQLTAALLPALREPFHVCRCMAAAQHLLPYEHAVRVRAAAAEALAAVLPGLPAEQLVAVLAAVPVAPAQALQAPLPPQLQAAPSVTPSEAFTAPDQTNVPAWAKRIAAAAAAGTGPGPSTPVAVAPSAAATAFVPPPPPPASPLALPPPLCPAAHTALRGVLPSCPPELLVELLRVLGARDALPGYGWQGALAADLGQRIEAAAAAARQSRAPAAAGPSGSAALSAVGASPPPSPQELCNTLFTLAALNYRPPGFAWTAAAASAMQPHLLTLPPQQLTNALWALVRFGHRVSEPRGTWASLAVQAVQLTLPQLQPQQLSYCLGCLQRLGCHVGGSVLDEMLDAAAAGPAAGGRLAATSPSDVVLLLVTVARLGHVPSYRFTEAITERLRPHLEAAAEAAAEAEAAEAEAEAMDAAKPPGPGAGTGAAGDVGAGLPRVSVQVGGASASAAEAGASGAGDGGGERAAAQGPSGRGRVGASSGGVGGGARPLTAQELASVGYALAKLHSRPEPDWMQRYMAAVRGALPSFPPDLLATTLWAVAELGQAPDPAWLSAALSAARPLLPAFEPRDLVSLLSVLAALRRPPPAEWLGEALTVLGARVGALDGQGVAALLKALVDLDARVSNPDWYDALCRHVAAWLPLMPADALCELVGALGALGHAPGAAWVDRCGAAALRVMAQAQAAAARAGAGSAAASAAGPALQRPTGLTSVQLEALVCGMARLGGAPPAALLQSFYASTGPQLASMPPDRLTAIASTLAGASPPVAPEPDWLDELAAAVRQGVMSYSLVQLDAMARAVAVFQGLRPTHGPTADLLAFLREFCLYG